MKKLIILLMAFLFSCGKDTSNKNCGCDTTNYIIVTNQKGILIQEKGVWYLVNDNTTSFTFTGFICNQESSVVKSFTSTNTIDSIHVLFSGKKMQLCASDSQHQTLSANYFAFNIKIDSLKNN